MEYERDNRNRFYFWRSLQVAMFFFGTNGKKLGALQKATAQHQDHDMFLFGIPINLCFLPLLGGGSFVCSGSLINFIPSPHVGPSQLWGLRNYLVLPWYLALLYNFKWLTSVCFNTWLRKALRRKTWFESKLTNHSGLIKFCESRFCCTNLLYQSEIFR